MKQKHLRRFDSVIQTVAFCELPSSITATAGIANFAPTLAIVKGKIVIIQNYNLLGSATTKGVTLNLIDIRKAMSQNTYALANALVSYAASLTPPDNNIIQQAKLTAGSLENMTKQNCVTKCDGIQQLAAANAAGILPFGASATLITDTAALVTLYLNGMDDPRGAKMSRASANTQALQTLNQVISVDLELKLDTMANTLRYTNNEWWLQYRAAREIIDPPAFSTVLKLKVMNGATNQPLKGAKCYRDAGSAFKRSTKLGFVTYKDIEDGNHTFLIKHKKFNDLAVPAIPMNYGNKKTVTVVMFPVGSNGIQMISKEGGVNAGTIVILPVEDVNPTPATIVTIEVTENPLVISASDNTDPVMGPVTWALPIGTYIKTIAEFGALIGATDTANIIKLQSPGPNNTHYKITFTNLQG